MSRQGNWSRIARHIHIKQAMDDTSLSDSLLKIESLVIDYYMHAHVTLHQSKLRETNSSTTKEKKTLYKQKVKNDRPGWIRMNIEYNKEK